MPDPSDNPKSSRGGRGKGLGRKPAPAAKVTPEAESVEAWLAQRLEAFGDEPTSETDDDAPTLLVRGRTSPRPPPARIEIPREPRAPTATSPPTAPSPRAALSVTPSIAPRAPVRDQASVPPAPPGPMDPPSRETPPMASSQADEGPATEPVRPPGARVTRSQPPSVAPTSLPPLDPPAQDAQDAKDAKDAKDASEGLAPTPEPPPSLDEDATEHGDDGEPSYVRPSNTWGAPSSEPVEVADLGFDLPDPPSGEVTKPAPTAVEAWDLLGESDGRGFAAIGEPTDEKTGPGGWSTAGQPAASATGPVAEPPKAAAGPIVVSSLGHHRSDDDQVVDALIARADSRLPAGSGSPADGRAPRRKPGAFSRYTEENTSDGDAPTVRGHLDEVFPRKPEEAAQGEDTGDLLGETQVGGRVPWGSAGPPAAGPDPEGTAWMPQGLEVPTPDPLDRGAIERAGAAQRGATAPPAPPRTPPTPAREAPGREAARDPGRKLEETAIRRAAQEEEDRSTKLMLAERFEDPEEKPRSWLAEVAWTVVKWGTVAFVILSFLVLMGVVTAVLLPSLLQL